MQEHHLDLSTLTALGKAEARLADGILEVRMTHSIAPISWGLSGDSYKRHAVAVPGTYPLPFRVDMTVRLDYPAFLLLVGGGHIGFHTPGDDNRKIEDIARPSGKPNQDRYSFDNRLPLGEFTHIQVTYGREEMQILIDGEERFYSRKQPYMRAREPGGFGIRIAVAKHSTLSIRGITITEFDEDPPLARGSLSEKEPATAELPPALREELLETERHLLSLRPLKCKRTSDKSGHKITYVCSEYGISYAIKVHGDRLSQDLGWYIVYNGPPETWHRKADYMEETLDEIAKTDPELAARLFPALNDCVGCTSDCLARTLYAHGGEKRLTCHGRIVLRPCAEDMRDARAFFGHLNALIERGVPPPEKIFLSKKE